MKRRSLVPLMVALALLAVEGLRMSARAQESKAPQVDLGTPFTLAVGERAQAGSEEVEVLLRSLDGDSGCMTLDDCSIMLFKGIALLRVGDKRQMAEIDASFRPDQPFYTTFEGFKFEILDVRRAAGKGPLQATFRVTVGEEEKKE